MRRGSSHHTWWSEINCQDSSDGEGCFHSCPLCSDLHKHTKGLRCIMLAQQRQLVSHSLDQCVKTFLNLKASDEHHTPWCRLKTFSLKLEGLPSPLLFAMTWENIEVNTWHICCVCTVIPICTVEQMWSTYCIGFSRICIEYHSLGSWNNRNLYSRSSGSQSLQSEWR